MGGKSNKSGWGDCRLDGCERGVFTLKSGLCQLHYYQMRSGKDFTQPKPRVQNIGKLCKVSGCEEKCKVIGLCARHATQFYMKKKLTPRVPLQKTIPCAFPECPHTSHAKGWCRAHWYQQYEGREMKPLRDEYSGSCSIVGCQRTTTRYNQLCPLHYNHRIKFSLSLEKYLEIKAIKECQICKSTARLVIDHDHQCCPPPAGGTQKVSCGECVRGVLCTRCNTVVGNLESNPGMIQAIMAYISN